MMASFHDCEHGTSLCSRLLFADMPNEEQLKRVAVQQPSACTTALFCGVRILDKLPDLDP
ncbi:hypothetical protein EAI91_07825 [Lacticaseibacillus paracasei]|uniref:Uncharacterized protein n=1 Tax=Lacticaseibacillus paracasei TaxID=1597 RepID=A0AB36XD81_LACPA|nr:hypothetical protein LPEG9_03540 [Lacticaseibacillus paracasei]AZP98162.1 hypothetical protein CYL78_04565 [Lacticaseibacillus paracasei subsp. tolerans]PTS45459.1 hypothetical protein DBQ69_10005 [Lactobacillus sp. DS1_6]PTS49706.1 hypothetical protein DBQ60_09395 [Lactobacillus sp. DS2_6]PTS50452.1 hypothetical protein DBQ62_07400 [Lactobacillus sp. DS9_6]PTS56887.1 hypothetical protein DBQ61_07650 [Lactobacillus sp. DS22_6]PTS61315.1 hypothetical protein DBQ68_09275 [Lactobacillus sp. D